MPPVQPDSCGRCWRRRGGGRRVLHSAVLPDGALRRAASDPGELPVHGLDRLLERGEARREQAVAGRIPGVLDQDLVAAPRREDLDVPQHDAVLRSAVARHGRLRVPCLWGGRGAVREPPLGDVQGLRPSAPVRIPVVLPVLRLPFARLGFSLRGSWASPRVQVVLDGASDQHGVVAGDKALAEPKPKGPPGRAAASGGRRGAVPAVRGHALALALALAPRALAASGSGGGGGGVRRGRRCGALRLCSPPELLQLPGIALCREVGGGRWARLQDGFPVVRPSRLLCRGEEAAVVRLPVPPLNGCRPRLLLAGLVGDAPVLAPPLHVHARVEGRPQQQRVAPLRPRLTASQVACPVVGFQPRGLHAVVAVVVRELGEGLDVLAGKDAHLVEEGAVAVLAVEAREDRLQEAVPLVCVVDESPDVAEAVGIEHEVPLRLIRAHGRLASVLERLLQRGVEMGARLPLAALDDTVVQVLEVVQVKQVLVLALEEVRLLMGDDLPDVLAHK
mmetsp:Transcript_30719/g.73133  ORF Transcript_30719/g.73133 Transcript_30719/m.73133 type:complete len:505 (+) Transcript_30719:653-2167(+)